MFFIFVFFIVVCLLSINSHIQNQRDAFLSGVFHFSFPICNIQYFPVFTIAGLYF